MLLCVNCVTGPDPLFTKRGTLVIRSVQSKRATFTQAASLSAEDRKLLKVRIGKKGGQLYMHLTTEANVASHIPRQYPPLLPKNKTKSKDYLKMRILPPYFCLHLQNWILFSVFSACCGYHLPFLKPPHSNYCRNSA